MTAFHRPCGLQYAEAAAGFSVTWKTASGFHARLETVHLKALYRFQEYSFHGMLDRSDLDGNGIAYDVPRRHMLFMSAAGHMGHKLLTDSQCLIADHGLLSQRIELYPVFSFCAYACIAQRRIDRERMPSFSGGSNAMLLIS